MNAVILNILLIAGIVSSVPLEYHACSHITWPLKGYHLPGQCRRIDCQLIFGSLGERPTYQQVPKTCDPIFVPPGCTLEEDLEKAFPDCCPEVNCSKYQYEVY